MSKRLETSYPYNPESLDEGLFGAPKLRFEACTSCGVCVDACPTTAIKMRPTHESTTLNLEGKAVPIAKKISVQLTNCIFCGRCQDVCGNNVFQEERLFELGAYHRKTLQQIGFLPFSEEKIVGKPGLDASLEPMIERVNLAIFGVFQKSLKLFVANVGSCGGCEDELETALGPFYQGTKLGVELVKEPLHADAFLVAGPITKPLLKELQAAYRLASSPKLVMAAGACACDGNVFRGSYAVLSAADRALPIDVYLPGCPPPPRAFLHGLLLLMERAKEKLTPSQYLAPGLPQALLQSLKVEAPTRPMPLPEQREKEPPKPELSPAPSQTSPAPANPTTASAPPTQQPPPPVAAPAPEATITAPQGPTTLSLTPLASLTEDATTQINPEREPLGFEATELALPSASSLGKPRAALPLDPDEDR